MLAEDAGVISETPVDFLRSGDNVRQLLNEIANTEYARATELADVVEEPLPGCNSRASATTSYGEGDEALYHDVPARSSSSLSISEGSRRARARSLSVE